jgi:hypothetical protein
MPFFTEIDDQPFFFAWGYHMPGDNSPFLDYIEAKMLDAVKTPAGPGAPPAAEGSAENEELAEAVKQAVDFYRMVEGANMYMALSPDGMKEAGDFVGKDQDGIMRLAKSAFSGENPLMQKFAKGFKVESLGTKKVGSASVDQFSFKLDAADPMAAQAAAVYGESGTYAIGQHKGRVRFCLGNEDDMKRVFSDKVKAPLASSSFVKNAMAALPTKRNMVILVDPATAVGSFGALMGMPPGAATAVPPGPPIAVSVSLSGEPARLDIRVPAQTIKRIKQAVAPDEPM